jgi:hypothetical protein
MKTIQEDYMENVKIPKDDLIQSQGSNYGQIIAKSIGIAPARGLTIAQMRERLTLMDKAEEIKDNATLAFTKEECKTIHKILGEIPFTIFSRALIDLQDTLEEEFRPRKKEGKK